MLRFFPLAVLAGFVAELASLIWVGGEVGVMMTLVLLAAGAVAGIGVIRSTGLGLAAAVRQAEFGKQFSTVDAGVAFLRMAAGLLLLVPGFFSDGIAILLMVPPVARWLAGRFTPPVHMQFRPPVGPRRHGPVIDEDAVEIEADVRGLEKSE